MGHYLSMFKNRKPDPVLGIRPDENYAREIMQLFSVGLVQLNMDGSVVSAGGQPVPTYGQDTIRGFAHVFTGWNWANCQQQLGMESVRPVDWPDPGWDAWWLCRWRREAITPARRQAIAGLPRRSPAGRRAAGGSAVGPAGRARQRVRPSQRGAVHRPPPDQAAGVEQSESGLRRRARQRVCQQRPRYARRPRRHRACRADGPEARTLPTLDSHRGSCASRCCA